MVVYVVFGIERGEWKPRKLRRKLPTLHRRPKFPRPLDVVIAVEVATANRGRRPLKLPENDADGDGAD